LAYGVVDLGVAIGGVKRFMDRSTSGFCDHMNTTEHHFRGRASHFSASLSSRLAYFQIGANSVEIRVALAAGRQFSVCAITFGLGGEID